MTILGWTYWAAYQLVSIVLTVIGWPLLGVLAFLELWVKKDNKWQWRGGWLTWLWCNNEDGIIPPGARVPDSLLTWHWSAWRNSVNNMRLIPGAFFLTDNTLTYKMYSWGYVATQGWRQCVMYKRYRFGWLISLGATPGYRCWPVLEKV
jgi:hypothetical protein